MIEFYRRICLARLLFKDSVWHDGNNTTFEIVFVLKCKVDEIKEDTMDEACSTH
jgi:hypothetical protein